MAYFLFLLSLMCSALWMSTNAVDLSNVPIESIETKFGEQAIMLLTPRDNTPVPLGWCSVRLPGRTEFVSMEPEFEIEDRNLYMWHGRGLSCDLAVRQMSEQYIGLYEIVGEHRANVSNFRRYQLKIRDDCDPIPKKDMTLVEGDSVMIGLSKSLIVVKENDTPGQDPVTVNCTATSPTGHQTHYVSEPSGRCMFNVLNATKNETEGKWTLNGNGDNFRLSTTINLGIIERPKNEFLVELLSGTSAKLTFGSEKTIYCEYKAPNSRVTVQRFGECSVEIPKVLRTLHEGKWEVSVGVSNSMSTQYYVYDVKVHEIDGQRGGGIVPYANYTMPQNELDMSCILAVKNMSSCRFVRSDGEIFFAGQHLGVGKYEHFSREKLYGDYVECGIRVRSPDRVEMEPWQCYIVHDDNVTESASWVQMKNYTEDNSTDKFIHSSNKGTVIRGGSVNLLCKYSKPINYCWFTSHNRTRHTVLESSNTPAFKYFGDGFQVGHCGITIKSTHLLDSGSWKCNVGKVHGDSVDAQASINVRVLNSPLVPVVRDQLWQRGVNLTCKMYDGAPLEYCRFIMPDGRGINPTSKRNLDQELYPGNATDLERGICSLSLRSNYLSDLGSWTCVAKPLDGDVEYSGDLYIFTYYYYYMHGSSGLDIFLWMIILIGALGTACLVRLLYVRYRQLKGRRRPRSDTEDSISTTTSEIGSQLPPPSYVVAMGNQNGVPKDPLP